MYFTNLGKSGRAAEREDVSLINSVESIKTEVINIGNELLSTVESHMNWIGLDPVHTIGVVQSIQAKFAWGGSILSLNQFRLLIQLPEKIMLDTKIVKYDCSITPKNPNHHDK